MLPLNNNANKTIYINPNFKGHVTPLENDVPSQTTSIIPLSAHINPLFLGSQKNANTIHMNPAFLHKFQHQQIENKNTADSNSKNLFTRPVTDIDSKLLLGKNVATESRKIICKSKNRLIREPMAKKDNQVLTLDKTAFAIQPLLVLNKSKLVRKMCSATVKQSLKKEVFGDFKTRPTKYKLDNRLIKKKVLFPPTPKIRKTSYVGRYALKRTSLDESSNKEPRKLPVNNNKNKKLQLLNINGLLYKSTRNSLKLKDISPARMLKSSQGAKLSPKINQGLIIFVRGDKYVMDANKFKLTRVTNCDQASSNYITRSDSIKSPTCKRIDIGGYTYVSLNSTKNVLIRTKNHLSRAYVHNAKQKSLQMLTKRLVKTNIPCPMFQRIGKCAAFERGKCSKVHNKLQVSICSKFLRGECNKPNCLLSHNVSLSKMPVCKFFLQGVCVRNDCPYLHKKLSNSTELCTDFLRGFCQMADKCNKRHEFVCPEIERNNICTNKKCIYCNTKKRKEGQMGMKLDNLTRKNSTTLPVSPARCFEEITENQSSKRYFVDGNEKFFNDTNESNAQSKDKDTANNISDTVYFEENIDKSVKTRPKLGTLPAYIPL